MGKMMSILCEALEIPRGTLCNHILRNKRANARLRNAGGILPSDLQALLNIKVLEEKIWMILAQGIRSAPNWALT